MANLLIVGVFFGPQDSAQLLSYLSMWSIAATFATMLMQFKAATYEQEKIKSTEQDKFQYSVYYKREALQSLEITHAINFVTFIGYYVYVFPQTWKMWQQSVVDQTYGEGDLSQGFYYVQDIILHTVPFMMSFASIFVTETIFLETDWFLICNTTIVYLLVNWAVTKYSGTDSVFFLDWSEISSINAYSPLVAGAGFTILGLAQHFFLCMFTQLLNQNYEYQYEDKYTGLIPGIGDA